MAQDPRCGMGERVRRKQAQVRASDLFSYSECLGVAAIGTLYKKGVVVHDALMDELEAICISNFGATPKAPSSSSASATAASGATKVKAPASVYAQNRKPWDV